MLVKTIISANLGDFLEIIILIGAYRVSRANLYAPTV